MPHIFRTRTPDARRQKSRLQEVYSAKLKSNACICGGEVLRRL